VKRLPLLALAIVLVALAGCGSSSSSSSTAPAPSATASTPASGGAAQVKMQNLAFSPDTVHAKVGQTVQWTNDDSVDHNVSYVSGPKFHSSSNFGDGGKFSIKLTQPGTIHYVCTIHRFMTATIVVTK
jgi:plastocyanin